MGYRKKLVSLFQRSVADIRPSYRDRSHAFLEENILDKDPIKLFHIWFEEAKNNPSIVEPNAMCLSTATRDGIPSARFVLCKNYGDEGFSFFTHYTSRKGKELEENPNVALTFYWNILNRSIRIEGTAKKLPMSDGIKYFKSRPHASQIGALSSNQSIPIESRAKLVSTVEELANKFKEGEVPKPEFWGGYVVIPKVIEFWQGQTDRVHDRIRFRLLQEEEIVDNVLVHKGHGNWVYERLQP